MDNFNRPAGRGGLAIDLDLARHDAGSPLFGRIATQIARAIRGGRLRPGDRLPGSRSLAESLGVHRNTVLSAYAELDSAGWTESRPASGTFVCAELPRPEALAPRASSANAARRREPGYALPVAARERPERSLASRAEPPLLELSDAQPDVARVPHQALARAYRRALSRHGSDVLDYGDPQGHPRLREALGRMLAETRGLAVGAEDVLVTRGSQMALDLVARVLTRPGDVVAVEALGYPPAWRALSSRGAALEPVPVDAEGLRVDRLEALCEKRRDNQGGRPPIRAVYVTPHHQYPTAVPLSAARRLALLDLARRERFAIIEDDHAHEFHYRGRPLMPMASADPAGVAIYVGTLSKLLSPGLRTGYVVAPSALLERLVDARRYVDRQGDLPTELALAELLEDGEIARHGRRMRRLYLRRRDAMLDAIDRHLSGALQARTPDGGMALWARVDARVDLAAWVERAREAGLGLKPARVYALDRRPRPFVRLSFSGRSEEESEAALRRLAACLPAAPRRAARSG